MAQFRVSIAMALTMLVETAAENDIEALPVEVLADLAEAILAGSEQGEAYVATLAQRMRRVEIRPADA